MMILGKLRKTLLISTCFLLSSCAQEFNATRIVKDVSKKNQSKIASSIEATEGRHLGQVVSTAGAYVNAKEITIPAEWKEKNITIRAHEQPLKQVLLAIFYGVPESFSFEEGADKQLVNASYSGPLIGALNRLAEQNDISFSVKSDGGIPHLKWSSLETKVFPIAFVPGETKFSVSGSGGFRTEDQSNSGSSGGSDSGSSGSDSASLTGSVNIWQDLSDTVKGMLTPKLGIFSVSEALSSITVRDKPHVVKRVEEFIKTYNSMLSKRVALKIQILEVNLSESHSSGIDWKAVYTKEGETDPTFSFNTSESTALSGDAKNSGSFSANVLSGIFKNSSAILKALSEQGVVSVMEKPTIMTLNNQPYIMRFGEDQAYIKETSVTSSGEQGSDKTVSFTPGNIRTGIQLAVIPHIQEDKIYLSLSLDISAKKPLQTVTSGEGKVETQIQLPTTTARTFNQRVMAHSGNVIVLSGFIKSSDDNTQRMPFGMKFLRGNQVNRGRTEMVVLIQPILVDPRL